MFWRRVGLGVILPAFLAAFIGVSGCITAPSPWPPDKKPRVVVTIPPLVSFVKNVAGENGAVQCLCTTTGPHHYEYNVQNTLQLHDADLFLAIGMGLDNKFADPMYDHSQNPHLIRGRTYLHLGDGLPAKLKLKSKDHDGDHKDAHGHDHEHGEFDPHVWLGIAPAKQMVDQICEALIAVDREHENDYAANAEEYKKKLDRLHADGKKSLPRDSKIISFHESLGYFADSFNLDVVDVIERAPGSAPTPGDINRLKTQIQDQHVKVVAVEPQYASNNSAETLKKEVGDKDVKLVVVDPLETADEKDLTNEKWYEDRMRANIDNLAKALK
jgi:ABC-type Zn uptake system ZnuABC Zn-binding protein ZnuA